MYTVTGTFTFGVVTIIFVILITIWFLTTVDWSTRRGKVAAFVAIIFIPLIVGWILPVLKMRSPQLIPGKNVEVAVIENKAALVQYERGNYTVVEHPYLVKHIRDTSKVDIHFYKIRPLLGEHPFTRHQSPQIRIKYKK